MRDGQGDMKEWGPGCAGGSWGLRLGRPANGAMSQKGNAVRGRQKLRTGREVGGPECGGLWRREVSAVWWHEDPGG